MNHLLHTNVFGFFLTLENVKRIDETREKVGGEGDRNVLYRTCNNVIGSASQ